MHWLEAAGRTSSLTLVLTFLGSSIVLDRIYALSGSSLSGSSYQAEQRCDVLTRRQVALSSLVLSTSTACWPTIAAGESNTATGASLRIPLTLRLGLSAYTVSYRVGGARIEAIVDTGSPFLFVPKPSESTCSPSYEWGCLRDEGSPVPGLTRTVERFDGNEGYVDWSNSTFSFDRTLNDQATTINDVYPLTSSSADQSALFPVYVTFGILSESLLDGTGGIFLGLVKYTERRIRPSFLSQSNVEAFSIDLRNIEGRVKSLSLYGGGQLPRQDVPGIPLVRDLNQRFGDPTIHYCAVADKICVNDNVLASSTRKEKLYVIFDTGCSGLQLSPALFDERYATARANKEKSLFGTVDITFQTAEGNPLTLSSKKPLTTPLGSNRPWGKRINGYLLVVGLAFLEDKLLTVDICKEKIYLKTNA
mmetsp:Transcript_23487/g.55480  ORF Transcript_23487/g.55480 Transcript_23487/m.55480 type:complete len:420 (-) Transcript_23487:448-1707(-)